MWRSTREAQARSDRARKLSCQVVESMRTVRIIAVSDVVCLQVAWLGQAWYARPCREREQLSIGSEVWTSGLRRGSVVASQEHSCIKGAAEVNLACRADS